MTEPVVPRLSIADELALNTAFDPRNTDTGNGKRFVTLYGSIVRYVVDLDSWYTWVESHWDPDVAQLRVRGLTEGVVRDLDVEALTLSDEAPNGGGMSPRQRMLRHALATESYGARVRMLQAAATDPRLQVRLDELNPDPNIVATPSGVVNLLTREVRPARPDDLCTACTLVAYDPNARSPELDRYLNTFMPDEDDQRVLFAVLGTALRGGNPARILPIFLGGTTSGKTQLISAIANLLRGYATAINVSVFRGNLDEKPRPDLVKAMYSRIAYATEASKTWELHADQVKRLTGGDKILYRNLYATPVEATPRFTPLIITNDMPRVRAADAAFKRRMIVIKFEHSIDSMLEDTRIRDRFVNDEVCLRALFTRIVEGAADPLLASGLRLDLMPTKFVESTQASFNELDSVQEFVDWMVEQGHLTPADIVATPASHCAKAADLHAAYRYWLRKHGDVQMAKDALSIRDFGAQLRARGWESRMAAGTRWVGWQLTNSSEWLTFL